MFLRKYGKDVTVILRLPESFVGNDMISDIDTRLNQFLQIMKDCFMELVCRDKCLQVGNGQAPELGQLVLNESHQPVNDSDINHQ